mgnify:CR=1 FL=1
MPAGSYSITLKNQHEQLLALENWLHLLAASCRLSAEVSFRLELVLTEAVTNVMDYSCDPGREGLIALSCEVQEDRLQIQISDDGPPFDPTARAPVNLPKSLEEARPGGLGIHLMRQYTRGMQYKRDGDRNVLRMYLPLSASRPSA